MKTVIEYDLFLPAADPSLLAEVRRDLVAHFGGLTDSRHRQEGIWRFGTTQIKDEITVWRILSDRGAEGDAYLGEVKRRLERVLDQKEILIVRRNVAAL